MKTVRNLKSWLKKLTRLTTASALIMLSQTTFSSSVAAQEGPATYGRTPFGGAGSGAASGVIDSNQRGFGVSFRGGHVAGGTVGRNDSVSHISLTPYISIIENGLLFGDSRLIMNNNTDLAWSFGGGYRHYIPEWDVVVGGNSYYDQDRLTGAHLGQWGAGAELLANRWEARGNYYQTTGTTSALVGSTIDQNSVAFVGSNIQFTRIDNFAEGLKGFDSEVGFLLPGDLSERIDLRLFGGGYFYEGSNIDGFGGWSGRLQADIAKWLELGLKVTNDTVFDTTVSFNAAVHFGGFKSQEHTSRSAIQRFSEPVRRNLNVVTAQTGVAAPGQIATNPLNGLPFEVAHVNSNDLGGPFLGTVEDPFNSLFTGLGSGADVVFVHAGSQFNALPDNVVNLAPGQQLLGEGLISDATGNRLVVNTVTLGDGIGTINLPASPTFLLNDFQLARPILSNSVGNAVTLASDTQFSWFILQSPGGTGVFGNGVSNSIVNDVWIQNAGGKGIDLVNSTDVITIRNTIIDQAAGIGLHVRGGDARIGFVSTSADLDPSYAAIFNSSDRAVLIEDMTGGSVNMFGSTIDDAGGSGILIQNTSSDVTIDNASITGSTDTGISILNSSGSYTFRDTLRQETLVDGATNDAILIDSLLAGGRVSFENLTVQNRNAAGINVTNNAGQISFGGTQSVTNILPAAAGTAAAVSVTGSQAQSSTRFAGTLNINSPATNGAGPGGGIELTGNAAESVFSAETVNISGTQGDAIAIFSDASAATFGGPTTITNRGSRGIFVDNFSGGLAMNGRTSIDNPNNAPDSAFVVQDSSGGVGVESLGVVNATGVDPAVFLERNTGLLSFTDINVDSINVTGFHGRDNDTIQIVNGIVSTTGARAVDIENSGVRISLEQVNSAASPDFGIRLVETNRPAGFNDFKVTGDTTQQVFNSGGIIQGAGQSGVWMENAGQVRLDYVLLDDNQNGIEVRNSGLLEDDDQSLQLNFVEIQDSNVRGIYALNLIQLDIRDSFFDNNGDDATLGAETLLTEYDEIIESDNITRFSQSGNPYTVVMFRNTITDNSTDAVVIGNRISAFGAVLGVNLADNVFTLSDLTDPAGPAGATPTTLDPANIYDPNGVRDDAIVVEWNGPSFQTFTTNNITLNGAAAQHGFQIQTTSNSSPADLYELEIIGNTVISSVTGTGPGEHIGVNLDTSSPSDIVITGNNLGFTGGNGTGFRFDLASQTVMNISNNTVIDDTNQGKGIIFDRVRAESLFIINGNFIELADNGTPRETGIRFNAVSGVVGLQGNLNNTVLLQGQGTFFAMPNGSNNGQIIVNGVLVP